MERIGKKLMKHEHQHSRKAFTLIELLIVVAIIAILAAIAVPNFLEAQVRSKVARVKTDMRSIATGLESYTVDYNRSILGWREWNLLNADPTFDGEWKFLTTPTAYMTSVPNDPFALPTSAGGSPITQDSGKKFLYNSFYTDAEKTAYQFASRAGYTWYMRSCGPSLVNPLQNSWYVENNLEADGNNDAIGKVAYVYDATNGTKSQGFILRTNKGMYLGQ